MLLLIPSLSVLVGCATSNLRFICQDSYTDSETCHKQAEELCGENGYSVRPYTPSGTNAWGSGEIPGQDIWERERPAHYFEIVCKGTALPPIENRPVVPDPDK